MLTRILNKEEQLMKLQEFFPGFEVLEFKTYDDLALEESKHENCSCDQNIEISFSYVFSVCKEKKEVYVLDALEYNMGIELW